MFKTLRVRKSRNQISSIYKKDYKRDIASYIPITILNLDYKIYTNSFESNAKNI